MNIPKSIQLADPQIQCAITDTNANRRGFVLAIVMRGANQITRQNPHHSEDSFRMDHGWEHQSRISKIQKV